MSDLNPIVQLIQTVVTKLFSLANRLFEWLFGSINFNVLWSWLPSDIIAAAQFFVLLLFTLMLIKLIKSILPF